LVPHVPQLLSSVMRFAQKAVAPLPQSVWPAGHAQTPATHACPVAHLVPHEPQLFASGARFVQTALAPLPQTVWPEGQLSAQVPLAHV
jgi:hypothetical protein